MNNISIHTLRVEGDVLTCDIAEDVTISIHTLRVEGDLENGVTTIKLIDFNPHPPRGG